MTENNFIMAKIKNKIMKKILGVKRPLKMGVKRPLIEAYNIFVIMTYCMRVWLVQNSGNEYSFAVLGSDSGAHHYIYRGYLMMYEHFVELYIIAQMVDYQIWINSGNKNKDFILNIHIFSSASRKAAELF